MGRLAAVEIYVVGRPTSKHAYLAPCSTILALIISQLYLTATRYSTLTSTVKPTVSHSLDRLL